MCESWVPLPGLPSSRLICCLRPAAGVGTAEQYAPPPYNPARAQARATHGTHQGTWYFEVHIEQLGKSGAARLG